MGIGIRLMPGLRVALTGRGIRTSIGPRAARIHVGAGRPSISTGAGPVTLWQGIGSGSRRRTGLQQATTARQAERAREAFALQAADDELTALHLEAFPPASPPARREPLPVDEVAVHRRHKNAATADLSLFDFSGRRKARVEAQKQADAEVDEQRHTAERAAELELAAARETWTDLLANDPATVVAVLESVFEDNLVPAAPIDVADGMGIVLLVAPGVDVVPQRKVALTASGRVTHHARSKSEVNGLYLAHLASSTLATAREALAACPNLHAVRILVVERIASAGIAPDKLQAVIAVTLDRHLVQSLDWPRIDISRIIQEVPGSQLTLGRANALRPISLDADEEALLARLARKGEASG